MNTIKTIEQMVGALQAVQTDGLVGHGAFVEDTIQAGRALLEELKQSRSDVGQEPVAWVHAGSFDAMIEANAGYSHIYPSKQIGASKPLYTHPQPAQPKRDPLTDEQIEMIWTVDQTSADDCASLYYAKVIARAIEAAHGIKGAA